MPKPYTAEDKMATMLLALTVGVSVAAERRDTPGSTIYDWLNEGGGIVNIRNVAQAAMLNAGLEARRAIYGAVSERGRGRTAGPTTGRRALSDSA